MGDRRHAAGAGHEDDRGAGRQGADDGAHVAAAVRVGVVPRPRPFRTEEHHVRDRHQTGVLALALHRGGHARSRHSEQPHVPAVHRRRGRPARPGAVFGRGRPRRVPHTRVRPDAHLHTH